jgi:hypothetical protein
MALRNKELVEVPSPGFSDELRPSDIFCSTAEDSLRRQALQFGNGLQYETPKHVILGP